MTKAELRTALEAEDVRDEAYSLDGAVRDNAVCLIPIATGWSVFYSERGSRWTERHHPTEQAACEDVLQRLLRDRTTRRSYQGSDPRATGAG